MQKSLPSYKQIKDKYKEGQTLSPVEIGRGVVFLLIEELADDTLPNAFFPDNTLQDSGEFYIAMLQNLTELSKQHLDVYDMVYYTSVMICCIRCLVHEHIYCVETLSENLKSSSYARQQLEQISFIDKTIAEADNKNISAVLEKIKNNYINNMPQTKKEADYKNTSQIMLLHISAINKFAEIISLHWDMPEILRLFYSSSKITSYNTWINSALDDVNKHIITEPKINLSEVKINTYKAKIISQLFEGRYLDISRLDAFLKALKDGAGFTISGGSGGSGGSQQ